MQAAIFGPANVPLVLVRAMQAVKSIGRVGSGSSVLAKAGASGRDSAGTPLITALRESCGYLRDADYHQTAQLMTVAADEIERLNRELRVSRYAFHAGEEPNREDHAMPTIEGGCLCGAVRYRSDAEPLMQVVCHCETCRKNSGSAFSMNVAVPQDTLRVESGSPRRYEDHSGASGKAFYRFFCGDCGSHVYSHGAAYGAIVFVKAGTLDDPSWLAPNMHIWCAEKLPWVAIPEGATQAPANPS
jgi:hypothetical protein